MCVFAFKGSQDSHGCPLQSQDSCLKNDEKQVKSCQTQQHTLSLSLSHTLLCLGFEVYGFRYEWGRVGEGPHQRVSKRDSSKDLIPKALVIHIVYLHVCILCIYMYVYCVSTCSISAFAKL